MKKIAVVCVSVLLAAALLGGAVRAAQTHALYANPVISWGVNPNTQERTPDPPDGSVTLLEKYDGFFVADTTEKKVYLTFDLGYEAGYTAAVLDILKQHGISAVFFLCGNYLKEEALINRMLSEGHAVGNHTDKHKDLPKLSEEAVRADICDFTAAYKTRFPSAPKMTLFRPPQGRFDEGSLKIAQACGLKTALWSIAIVDWGKTPIDAQASAKKIASRVHPGAVILLHITNSGTPEMLKLLLPELSQKGYQIGTPAEIG
ncbi:MAG: polysaccharide deacetylase family protein [Firmicutes bacterium]|nr:polysaccharide deacetylase family protein [Bacillota bacterium]